MSFALVSEDGHGSAVRMEPPKGKEAERINKLIEKVRKPRRYFVSLPVDLLKRRVYSVVGEPLFAYDFAHVLEEDFRLICSKCRWGEYPPKACVHIKAVLCWKRGLALRQRGSQTSTPS